MSQYSICLWNLLAMSFNYVYYDVGFQSAPFIIHVYEHGLNEKPPDFVTNSYFLMLTSLGCERSSSSCWSLCN